jgi:hypothetical protein
MIGLHKIEISENLCSYFVRRPFGNYLLFADELIAITDTQKNLIESCGGISKIILESTQNINDYHAHIFSRYGASALCDIEIEAFHPKVKIERLKDYRDPGFTFIFRGERKIIIVEQKNKIIMFVGKTFYFTKKGSVIFEGQDQTSYLLGLKNMYKVDLIYFTHFECLSVLNF